MVIVGFTQKYIFWAIHITKKSNCDNKKYAKKKKMYAKKYISAFSVWVFSHSCSGVVRKKRCFCEQTANKLRTTPEQRSKKSTFKTHWASLDIKTAYLHSICIIGVQVLADLKKECNFVFRQLFRTSHTLVHSYSLDLILRI